MIKIRFATKEDLQEMIGLYIDNNPEYGSHHQRLKEGLSALLDDSNKGHEVVAISEGEIIGRIHVATEWSVYRNANFWMFENVYGILYGFSQKLPRTFSNQIKSI